MNAFAKTITNTMPYLGIILALLGYFAYASRDSKRDLESMYSSEEADIMRVQASLLREAEARLGFNSPDFARQFKESHQKAEAIRAAAYARHYQSDKLISDRAAVLCTLGSLILIGVVSWRRDNRVELSQKKARADIEAFRPVVMTGSGMSSAAGNDAADSNGLPAEA